MQELEVTWLRAISVWWNFMWRSIVFGAVAGVVASLMLTLTGQGQTDSRVINLLIWLLTVPLGIWIVKILLAREYYDFRIVLLPVDVSETTAPQYKRDMKGGSALAGRQ